ncbi:STAS/SEC14 domain-containing protein [uncultured Sulfitobacter sp.]|uniref:STAS/SEC14 domain-containing protein n=1 Tax=uncultured Sulfitobacter sp. TaxID=191468 RepID=UPI0026040640|nr:STAS/SEC14 domain-containing protein [uncultured Sulfitobacter sp.]
MIEVEHGNTVEIITLRVSGTLSRADYDRALPEIENAMELAKEPLKMMVRLEDFQGLEIGAMWEDLKFALKHLGEFGAIAVVGDTTLEEFGTWLASLFAKFEIRYFEVGHEKEANSWLASI